MRQSLLQRLDPAAIPGYILFFLMLFVPSVYQTIKAPFVLLVLIAVLISVVRRGFAVHPTIVQLTLLNVVAGAFFIMVGLISGAPGALSTITVYCLWPILFTLFLSGLNEQRLHRLLLVLLLAEVAVALYAFSFLLTTAGLLPSRFFIPLSEMQEGVNIGEGIIEVSLASTATLIYAVPFTLAVLLTWPRDQRPLMPYPLLWGTLALGLAYTFVSGRRAALLTMALSPFFVVILWRIQSFSIRSRTRRTLTTTLGGLFLLASLTVLILGFRFGFDITKVASAVAAGFDFGANEDSAVRKEQFFALTHEWLESPLVGWGHGAVARGSLRSFVVPWSYELSYNALLFHTGLIGLLCYSAGVIWIYWQGYRMLRSGDPLGKYMLPILVGTTCFLMANASNPYLEKYDFMWVIFFPVALINVSLLRNRAVIGPAPAGALALPS